MRSIVILAIGVLIGLFIAGKPVVVAVSVKHTGDVLHIVKGSLRTDPVEESPWTGPIKPGPPRGPQYDVDAGPPHREWESLLR